MTDSDFDTMCMEVAGSWNRRSPLRQFIPVDIRTRSDAAPSGTAYFATIKANCSKNTVETQGPGPLKTFEFERYKGHLTIKSK